MSNWTGPPEWEPYVEEKSPGVWIDRLTIKPIAGPGSIEISPGFRFVINFLVPFVLLPLWFIFMFWFIHIVGD